MGAVDRMYGLYEKLPPKLQTFMVSGYGFVLHRRRYGSEHRRMFEFLMESLHWDRERLRAYEEARLQEVLQHAARHVPHYRELWARIGFRPADVRRVDDLAQLPVTEKDEVRGAPERFVSDAHRGKVFSGSTSGSTGMPLRTFKDRGCYQRTWAFQDRQRRIWGITGRGARVTLGNRPVVPPTQTRPPFWRHDVVENAWLFSNYHLSPNTIDAYLDKMAAIQPEEIKAYPSCAYMLASRAIARKETRIRPRTVISNAETLTLPQREAIEAAFGCKVADQYGAAEVPFWVGQCPQGTYHINHEFGILEAVRGSRPVRGEMGDVLGTGFVNRVQYLIRYRIGDSVVLPADDRRCSCGWDTDTVEQIEGRTDDVLYSPEGRAFGRLDVILKAIPGVLESQIVQDAPDHLTVNVVGLAGPSPEAEEVLGQRLRRCFGPVVRLDFNWVAAIPRGPNGKFRYQLNRLPTDVKITQIETTK